jgi:hypothetical protein
VARVWGSRSIKEKAAEHIYSSVIGALCTTAVFFVTSHQTNADKLKAEMQSETVSKLQQDKTVSKPEDVEFKFLKAMKASLDQQVTILSGSFRIDDEKQTTGAPQDKNGLFVAVFGEAPKSLLDELVGRDAGQKLGALITFKGFGDSRRLRRIEMDDVFGNGEPALTFDIVQDYADGSSILPVIVYKQADTWKLTAPQNFDAEADAAFQAALKNKTLKVSKKTLDWMAESKNDDHPNITFMEDWQLMLNGTAYKAAALRNSSDYIFFNHPQFGYKQLLAVASYFDDSVNAPHRIFVKAMKLATTLDGAKWVNDESWNHGKGFVSIEPFNFDELNAEKLYRLGTPTIGHVDYYGASFGKERRGL